MSPRGQQQQQAAAAVAPSRADGWSRERSASGGGGSARFGFMGNGITPTNHLAVSWFLQEVWPKVRAAEPTARLRLLGYPPDDRPKRLQRTPCLPASSPVRCGWAWGTVYAGKEAAAGIDELGFVSDEVMLQRRTGGTNPRN